MDPAHPTRPHAAAASPLNPGVCPSHSTELSATASLQGEQAVLQSFIKMNCFASWNYYFLPYHLSINYPCFWMKSSRQTGAHYARD